jgi:hypothetical protein
LQLSAPVGPETGGERHREVEGEEGFPSFGLAADDAGSWMKPSASQNAEDPHAAFTTDLADMPGILKKSFSQPCARCRACGTT